MTSVHQPFDVRIFYKECRTLAKAGYDVHLIAPCDRPDTRDGVDIRPLPLPAGRPTRLIRTAWQMYRAASEIDGDVYHFHDPELIGVGMLLKSAGKCVVYDSHENVAGDILTKEWIPRYAQRAVAASAHCVQKLGVALFDAVVAATPAIAALFPQRKCVIVQNFPLLDELSSAAASPYTERENSIVYLGVITAVRGAREMVNAIAAVPGRLNSSFLLAGDIYPDQLRIELQSLPGWQKTRYLGVLPRSRIANLLARARVGLVLFQPAPNYDDSQPTKLFEYMSAAVPVVASDFPEWQALIEGVGCGLVVDPRDPGQGGRRCGGHDRSRFAMISRMISEVPEAMVQSRT